MSELSEHNDSSLREFLLLKLAEVGEHVELLPDGTVTFSQPETWRKIYTQFLSSLDITKYWSVAWVKSAEYWQDERGCQSMALNFEAVRRGVMIHRIMIVRDCLWPETSLLPLSPVQEWIQEQHNHGLWIGLVRESAVSHEADLLSDVGIYGERAVGVQELDEHSQTVRFSLSFDQEKVRLANNRWERLKTYATSCWKLLDQLPPDG